MAATERAVCDRAAGGRGGAGGEAEWLDRAAQLNKRHAAGSRAPQPPAHAALGAVVRPAACRSAHPNVGEPQTLARAGAARVNRVCRLARLGR